MPCSGSTRRLGNAVIASVAVMLANTAGQASAQEWSARVGGFMTVALGYIDADESINNIETTVVNDAEVIINYRLVADNGITFGAKVEFEANGSSNNADEYVGFFFGDFGRVEVGAEDGAHDVLATSLVGGNFSSAAEDDGFLFDYNNIGLRLEVQGADTSDGLKVTYYTPTVSGFTAGVSYSPDGQEGRTASNNLTGALPAPGASNRGARREGVELGARYRETFGDVSVRLAAGYTAFLNDAFNTDDSYTLNAELGYAGFSIGAAYGVTNFNDSGRFANTENGVIVPEAEKLGIGAQYKTGPWFFGAQVVTALEGGTGRDAAGNQVAVSQEDNIGLSFEVNYALAPGVTVAGVAEYGSFDATPAGVDDDAYAVGVALLMTF